MEIVEQKQEVISVKDWVIIILITSIPVINIIMLCVWAFGDASSKTKANWAKAMLLWVVISFILIGIYFTSLMAIFASTMY